MAVKKKSAKPPRQSPGKTRVINRRDVGGFDELDTEPTISRRVLGQTKMLEKPNRVATQAYEAVNREGPLDNSGNPSGPYMLRNTQALKDKYPKGTFQDNPHQAMPSNRQDYAKLTAPKGDPRRTTSSDTAGYISPYRRRQMRLRAQDGN